MNDLKDKAHVYCRKCGVEKCKREELEESQWKSWTCFKCRKLIVGLALTDFIKTRISVMATDDEDRSKFIFRELLQNADDVRANILVLRFEDDALYVANDGRAFTTSSKGNDLSDFHRMSKILGRHQAQDKETVGHFGSGFQTVYAITNSPEVHSSDSCRIDPTRNKWDDNVKKMRSPYWKNEVKGSLFRLPWRDDTAALEEFEDGVRVFENTNDWPRWDRKRRRELFDDLTKYIHQAILCCQYLKKVRLIWHEQDRIEGFQVFRDFTLRVENEESTKIHERVGKLTEGKIKPENWKDQWEESFHFDNWSWESDASEFKYFIGSTNVTQDGARAYFGRRANGMVQVTKNKQVLPLRLKRGDVHVLFPLFDATQVFPEVSGRAFLYSVIPIPKRSRNMFIFSGHFYPTQDRKDVDVESFEGATGSWYRIVMQNIIGLYQHLFPGLLTKLHDSGAPNETVLRLVLNSIPATPLPEWMRPGKVSVREWEEADEEFASLIQLLLSSPILHYQNRWIKPKDSYWAQDVDEQEVLRAMGYPILSDDFVGHPHFSEILAPALEHQKVTDPTIFNNLWNRFRLSSGDKSGNLSYGQKIKDGILDKQSVESLIRFCITRKKSWSETLEVAVVPGKDGVLRPITRYPILPTQLQFLYELLPAEKVIHKDFAWLLSEWKEVEARTLSCDQVVELVDEMVRGNPTRFESLNMQDHSALSRVLEVLVEKLDFALKDRMKNLRFIPYKEGGTVSVGKPNVGARGQILEGDHIGENLQRDSIFGTQESRVPGLTPEVETRIRFLSLSNCGKGVAEKIEQKLSLVKLMDGNTPTNFVRHFLSTKHGSLFEDSELQKFLDADDSQYLEGQKRKFQEALRAYFKKEHTERFLTPEEMRKVPCLYDEHEKWHSAGSFSFKIGAEMKMLGYHPLSKELQKWPRETLLALGVVEFPSCARIVETIPWLLEERDNHREELGNITGWLLTSETPLTEEYERVTSLEWVPTTDGGYRSPRNALIPTSKSRRELGEDFGGFVDCSIFSPAITKRAKEIGHEKMQSRALLLKLKTAPDFYQTLGVAKEKAAAKEKPPPELFDALSGYLRENPGFQADVMNSKAGYYLNGEWIDSSGIRLVKEAMIPKELQATLTLIDPNHGHSLYLTADGAKDRLTPQDYLEPLAENQVTPTYGIWERLDNLHDEITAEDADKYGKASIYCANGRRIPPKLVIYLDGDCEEPFLKEGAIGEYHVIGPELTKSHGNALRKLGGRGDSQLGVGDLADLLRSLKKSAQSFDAEKISNALRLIKEMAKSKEESQFPSEKLWPAQKGKEYVWMNPKSCYLRDSPLSRYFEEELPFICLKISGKEDESLKEYAIASSCRKVSEHLRPVETHRRCRNDGLGSRRYREIADALGRYFKGIEGTGCFEWLKDAEAEVCDELINVYSVGEVLKNIEKSALIVPRGPEWVIFIDANSVSRQARGGFSLCDQLTDEIVHVCINQGFPEQASDELRLIVYKLLSRPQSSWGEIVPDYDYEQTEDTITPRPPMSGELFEPDYGLEAFPREYATTRSTLQNWYGCCQICNWTTPVDEQGIETCENVRRAILKVGGRYHGTTEDYSPDNSLLLCPRHHELYRRSLVKFPDFEEADEETVQNLKSKVKEYRSKSSKNPLEVIPWDCEVFEGRLDLLGLHKSPKGPESGESARWHKKPMSFTAEHLTGFLETMLRYLEESRRVQ